MNEITFNIIEHITVLSESNKGWTKELNLVSWNGRPAKYDIREWSPDHTQLGKGVTFTIEELILLKDHLEKMDLDTK